MDYPYSLEEERRLYLKWPFIEFYGDAHLLKYMCLSFECLLGRSIASSPYMQAPQSFQHNNASLVNITLSVEDVKHFCLGYLFQCLLTIIRY